MEFGVESHLSSHSGTYRQYHRPYSSLESELRLEPRTSDLGSLFYRKGYSIVFSKLFIYMA